MDLIEIEKIVLNRKKFPCKISKSEGILLKQKFTLIPQDLSIESNTKSLRFRYKKEINGVKYVLLEEYLFREQERYIDINRAIAIDYYLNKLEG